MKENWYSIFRAQNDKNSAFEKQNKRENIVNVKKTLILSQTLKRKEREGEQSWTKKILFKENVRKIVSKRFSEQKSDFENFLQTWEKENTYSIFREQNDKNSAVREKNCFEGFF